MISKNNILFTLAILLVHLPISAQEKEQVVDLVIGTYSKQNSEGLYTSSLNLSSGILTPAKLVFKSKDPTYLTVSKKGIVYASLREEKGQLAAFSINHKNQFSMLSRHKIGGNDPCYLALSPNQQFIASANYNGGNVSIFKLSASGTLDTPHTILTHTGHSIDPKRQTSPHPHWVKWSPYNDNHLYVIDLGTDKVMHYEFDYSSGTVSEGSVAYNSKPGNGPRHLVFHPSKKLAYILNELSNTVDLVSLDADGSFNLITEASTLPKGYMEHNQAAHIEIDNAGKFLYTSNRGLNSIAIFNLNEKGDMTLRDNVPTGGDWPRFFKLFNEYGLLLVANRKSNNITVFKVQADGGLLNTGHQLAIDQPTFVDEY